MPVPQTDIAWLAGFFDGEGTISLHRANLKIWKHPYLCPTFQAPNTDKRLIIHAADIIEQMIGVRPSITVSNKGGNGCKKAWRVRVKSQRQLAVILPILMLYLVSKGRQAELVLAFCQRRTYRQKHSWYEFKELDEAAYHESQGRRGRSYAPVFTGYEWLVIDRRCRQKNPQPDDVRHQGQGYKTRTVNQKRPLRQRFPLPAA